MRTRTAPGKARHRMVESQIERRGARDPAVLEALEGSERLARTVAAASRWDGPMEVKDVRPSHVRSYERLCHDAGVEAFTLALADPARAELLEVLAPARLEGAIGVIYRPETELASHYFQARLPGQFDEWIWFDETSAVTPLRTAELEGIPETYPFGV